MPSKPPSAKPSAPTTEGPSKQDPEVPESLPEVPGSVVEAQRHTAEAGAAVKTLVGDQLDELFRKGEELERMLQRAMESGEELLNELEQGHKELDRMGVPRKIASGTADLLLGDRIAVYQQTIQGFFKWIVAAQQASKDVPPLAAADAQIPTPSVRTDTATPTPTAIPTAATPAPAPPPAPKAPLTIPPATPAPVPISAMPLNAHHAPPVDRTDEAPTYDMPADLAPWGNMVATRDSAGVPVFRIGTYVIRPGDPLEIQEPRPLIAKAPLDSNGAVQQVAPGAGGESQTFNMGDIQGLFADLAQTFAGLGVEGPCQVLPPDSEAAAALSAAPPKEPMTWKAGIFIVSPNGDMGITEVSTGEILQITVGMKLRPLNPLGFKLLRPSHYTNTQPGLVPSPGRFYGPVRILDWMTQDSRGERLWRYGWLQKQAGTIQFRQPRHGAKNWGPGSNMNGNWVIQVLGPADSTLTTAVRSAHDAEMIEFGMRVTQ